MASPGVVLYLGNWGALCIAKDPSWERRIMTVANQKIEGTPWTEFREARLIRPLKPRPLLFPNGTSVRGSKCTWKRFKIPLSPSVTTLDTKEQDSRQILIRQNWLECWVGIKGQHEVFRCVQTLHGIPKHETDAKGCASSRGAKLNRQLNLHQPEHSSRRKSEALGSYCTWSLSNFYLL